MTVCIAAACEHGNMVVAATDGALSYGGLKSETGLYKGWWFGDWLFMYSGEPSNADLIAEQIRMISLEDKEFLKRERIFKTLRTAFRRHLASWSSDAVLSPFDMDLEEFKKEGVKLFGEKVVSELASAIRDRAQQFDDQILMVGWGKSEQSVVIHEENWAGPASRSTIGIAAIGSGGPTATSQMLLLGYNRNRRLEDTVYAVAAAKFAAEQADGVGKDTSLLVTWKRRETDPENRLAAKFFDSTQLDNLREIWEEHGRPKIPPARYQALVALTKAAEIPDEARSKHGAVSEAKWRDFKDRLNAPLKPGEKTRTVGF